MRILLLPAIIFVTFFSCKPQATEKDVVVGEKTYELEFSTPEEAGFNPDSLKKIDDIIRSYVDSKRFPGAVALVAKGGKIIYETEVGWSDSMQTEPYRKDHIFRMASMTKPFTSVAAMKLYEEGKLDLDDPVSKYIPEFANPMVLTSFNDSDTTWESRPANNEPTIRNLLNHTAGIPYAFINPPLFGAILAKHDVPDLTTYLDVTIAEKAAVLGALPLAHDPGEQWMYGLNTDVLGRVVEVASGMSLADYIDKTITDPLGIQDMDFFLNTEQGERLVDVYVARPDSVITYLRQYPSVPWMHPDYPVYGAKKYYSGGSGMSGTARDYFVFSQILTNVS